MLAFATDLLAQRWFRWFAAFAALVVLDFAWARYNIACTEKKPNVAGLYAIVIYALGGLTVITYVEDHWTLVPATAGSFFGTWLSVFTHKRGWRWRSATPAS